MSEPSALADDPDIPDEERLYRSIHPRQVHGNRPSSAAFYSRTNLNISVDRASMSTPEETLARHGGHSRVVSLGAGQARAVEQVGGIASDPIEHNPAHALVFREHGVSKTQWKKACRKMAKETQWEI